MPIIQGELSAGVPKNIRATTDGEAVVVEKTLAELHEKTNQLLSELIFVCRQGLRVDEEFIPED